MKKITSLPHFLVVALTLSSLACSSTSSKNPWSEKTTAQLNPPDAIGKHSAGCLSGAMSLTPDGVGFQVMRPSRRRHYGHPTLIDVIQTIGSRVHQEKLGTLLISDLSQPRGGPFLTGHTSHQTGLDADIWYELLPVGSRTLTLDERENKKAHSALNPNQVGVDPMYWSTPQLRVLEIAATPENVDRIFVSAHIKKVLCESEVASQNWVSKIRPWWGHADHFHVRLKCPKESRDCKNQDSPPKGNGCDETLAWWFTEEADKAGIKTADAPIAPQLPPKCEEVLQD